jgi:hypothetical protein
MLLFVYLKLSWILKNYVFLSGNGEAVW